MTPFDRWLERRGGARLAAALLGIALGCAAVALANSSFAAGRNTVLPEAVPSSSETPRPFIGGRR